MHRIDLDKNFSPSLSHHLKKSGIGTHRIDYELFQFAGGEWHVKITNFWGGSESKDVFITNRFRDMNDLMKVLLAKEALKKLGFNEFHLYMAYVPYVRQDRRCSEGEAFSLKVFSDLLNSAKFDSVTMIDAHSDVAPALINNSVNISNVRFVSNALQILFSNRFCVDKIHLVSPDSGANKKTNKLFDSLVALEPTIKCDKKRNTVDGSLSGFEVFTDDLHGDDCLIVDDICSFGGTFQGIAKALKEKNAGNIYLFVTHYEGTADETKMKDSGILHIFTTNSISDIKSDYITQFKL